MVRHRIKAIIGLLVVGATLYVADLANMISYEKTYSSGELVTEVMMNTATPPTTFNTTALHRLLHESHPGGNDSVTEIAMKTQPPGLAPCNSTPPGLVGPMRVFLDAPPFSELEALYPGVHSGGHGQPTQCAARHRVAVVVPYRDRPDHLRVMLHNLHRLLTKQQLDYGIFIVEQIADQTFNRAKLMNVGFVEALRVYPWQCFVFHDVDLLPEDDRNMYSCPAQPRHMSVAIDKFDYKLPYGSIFGGISALTREQVERVNGFSNDYWGWGGEDDDLSARVSYAGYNISRYPPQIARYRMIKHEKETKNPVNKCRYWLMKLTGRRWRSDGLSSLKYHVVGSERFPLYTHIQTDLLEKESRADLGKHGFPLC